MRGVIAIIILLLAGVLAWWLFGKQTDEAENSAGTDAAIGSAGNAQGNNTQVQLGARPDTDVVANNAPAGAVASATGTQTAAQSGMATDTAMSVDAKQQAEAALAAANAGNSLNGHASSGTQTLNQQQTLAAMTAEGAGDQGRTDLHSSRPAASRGDRAAVRSEANDFVHRLGAADKAVAMTSMDRFVPAGQRLLAPNLGLITAPMQNAKAGLEPGADVLVLRDIGGVQQVDATVARHLGDENKTVYVKQHGRFEPVTAGYIRTMVAKQGAVEVRGEQLELFLTTAESLQYDPEYSKDWMLVQGAQQRGWQLTSLGQLLGQSDSSQLYYTHTVRRADGNNLRKVIYNGIQKTLANGIALYRDEPERQVQASIPPMSQALAADGPLRRLVEEKVAAAYVYNYRLQRMRRQPAQLKVGQELVIVPFTKAELTEVYQQFVRQ